MLSSVHQIDHRQVRLP